MPQPYQAAAQAVTLGTLDTVLDAAPCAARGGLVPHRLGHGGQWVLCLHGVFS